MGGLGLMMASLCEMVVVVIVMINMMTRIGFSLLSRPKGNFC